MAEDGFVDELPECPLCMEPFGLDDINFYPCSCRYQVCRFCWHRIRTDENSLCPHCREPYSENPAEYTPLTQDQLVKLKSAKRQKSVEKRQKLVDSRKNLAAVRVVQRNLVFVIGLSPRLADPEVLRRNEYFGKYGRIYKVVINNHTVYSGAQGPSVSAYVTYYKKDDASKAIQSVNNAYIDGRYLKVSFGTTKYCTYFLRGMQCTKPDCMYLHELGETDASFTKEDMQMGKHQVFELAALAASNGGGGGGGLPLPPPPTPPAGSKEQHQPPTSTTTSSSTPPPPILPNPPTTTGVGGGAKKQQQQQVVQTLPPPPQPPSSSSSSCSSSSTVVQGREAAPFGDLSGIAESALPATASWASSKAQFGSSEQLSQPSSQHQSHSKDAKSDSSLSHSNSSRDKSQQQQQRSNAKHGHHHKSGSNSKNESGSPSHSKQHSSRLDSPKHREKDPSNQERERSASRSGTRSSTPMSPGSNHLQHRRSSSIPGSPSSISGTNNQTNSHSSYSHSHSSSGSIPNSSYQQPSEEIKVTNLDQTQAHNNYASNGSLSSETTSKSGTSTKSGTPNLSPNSLLSNSSSSGSLKEDLENHATVSASLDPATAQSFEDGTAQAFQDRTDVAARAFQDRTDGAARAFQDRTTDNCQKEQSEIVVETLCEENGHADFGSSEELTLSEFNDINSPEEREKGAVILNHEVPPSVQKDVLASQTAADFSEPSVQQTTEVPVGMPGYKGPPSSNKGPPSLVKEEEEESSAVKVITTLGAAGSGQFGALGVSWNGPHLSHPLPSPSHTEDELGFDPWDVSQQGLADLLDQEEEATPPHYRGVTGHSHKPRPFPASAGLISEHASSESRSWKAEFRALFPNVNISFGGSASDTVARPNPTPYTALPSASSLHHAVSDHTPVSTHPLGYSMFPPTSATPSSSSSSSSFTGLTGSSMEWPEFDPSSSCLPASKSAAVGAGLSRGVPSSAVPAKGFWGQSSAVSGGGVATSKEPSMKPPSSSSSLPAPPPGFTAKSKDSAEPSSSSSAGGSGGGVLSNSVNQALWASSLNKGQVHPNQLQQSWSNYVNFTMASQQQQQQQQQQPQRVTSAQQQQQRVTSAQQQQQQQRVTSAQAYQQLLLQQQYLAAKAQQTLLMQGHPFLQAQALAQLQQQQQQQQALAAQGGGGGGGSAVSSSLMLAQGLQLQQQQHQSLSPGVGVSSAQNSSATNHSGSSSSYPPGRPSSSTKIHSLQQSHTPASGTVVGQQVVVVAPAHSNHVSGRPATNTSSSGQQQQQQLQGTGRTGSGGQVTMRNAPAGSKRQKSMQKHAIGNSKKQQRSGSEADARSSRK